LGFLGFGFAGDPEEVADQVVEILPGELGGVIRGHVGAIFILDAFQVLFGEKVERAVGREELQREIVSLRATPVNRIPS